MPPDTRRRRARQIAIESPPCLPGLSRPLRAAVNFDRQRWRNGTRRDKYGRTLPRLKTRIMNLRPSLPAVGPRYIRLAAACAALSAVLLLSVPAASCGQSRDLQQRLE